MSVLGRVCRGLSGRRRVRRAAAIAVVALVGLVGLVVATLPSLSAASAASRVAASGVAPAGVPAAGATASASTAGAASGGTRTTDPARSRAEPSLPRPAIPAATGTSATRAAGPSGAAALSGAAGPSGASQPGASMDVPSAGVATTGAASSPVTSLPAAPAPSDVPPAVAPPAVVLPSVAAPSVSVGVSGGAAVPETVGGARAMPELGRTAGAAAATSPAAGAAGASALPDPLRRLASGRTYELHSNVWLTPEFRGTVRPLVIMLHGLVNTADSLREDSHADPFADTHGFAVAYGVGVHGAWNAGACCGGARTDDVGYVRQIVDDAARYVPVDRSRVYVWGFSNGGMLAARIACEAPDLVAAVGMVGGQVMESCPTVPVRLLHIHGTADATVPWRGGWSDYLRMNLPDGETEASRFAPGSDVRHRLWEGDHSWPWWAVGALWDFSAPASLAPVGLGGLVSVLSAG